MKGCVVLLFFAFSTWTLTGQENFIAVNCKKNIEQISALLHSNIAGVDSLLVSTKNCWSYLNSLEKENLLLQIGYFAERGDDSSFINKTIDSHTLEVETPLMKALKNGISVRFGNNLSTTNLFTLKELTTSNKINEQIVGYYFLGLNAINLGNLKEGESHLKKVIQLLQNHTDDYFLYKSFQSLAELEVLRNEYATAFDYLLKALDYAKKKDLRYERAYIDLLIGQLLLKMDNQKEAEFYLKKGLVISRGVMAIKLEADILSEMGVIRMIQKKNQEAISNFSLALSKYYRLNHAKGIAKAHLRLGQVHKLAQSYKLSKENYLLSQGYLEEIKDTTQLGNVFYCLAEIEFNLGDIQLAKSYVMRSLNLRTAVNNKFDLHKSLLLSSQINNRLGNYALAYREISQYSSFIDSVQQSDLQAKIAELSELYQAEQKENVILQQAKELEDLSIEVELREQKLENSALRNRQFLFLLLSVVFASSSIFVWYKFKRKQEKTAQLQQETELKQTLLRSQMNPHFIFNSMSVIQSYIYAKDVENSSLFIVNFSRLMRMILENSSKEFIPLSTELEILEKYLMIQQMRFEDCFVFEIATGDIDPNITFVPPMLTQPFIENAIEHARLESVDGGKIHIRFSLADGLMKIVVEDNGIGKDAATSIEKERSHESLAISITKERIELLNTKFGAQGSLEVLDTKSEGSLGTRATILTYFKWKDE
jgi:hypothetical protein